MSSKYREKEHGAGVAVSRESSGEEVGVMGPWSLTWYTEQRSPPYTCIH